MVVHHLSLHGLRKVLDLGHAYSVCHPNEFFMDVLERTLHIHTYDVVTPPHPMMMRETIQTSRTIICIYMTKYQFMSSHKNMSF